MSHPSAIERVFTHAATSVAHAAGKPIVFIVCCLSIIIWLLSGPYFRYSDTWQLVINTSTSVITFLMVFVIQNTQNRDGAALQAKLDELILTGAAANRFIGIEDLTDEELSELRQKCKTRAQARDGGAARN